MSKQSESVMSTRSEIEDRRLPAMDCPPDAPAGTAPQPSPDDLQRQAKRAEARAAALAAENKQLRAERTKAVLAAAQAQKSINAAAQPGPDAPQQRLDALTSGMKLAEDALRAAERERETAVRAAEEALHEDYARRIEAIHLQHSGAMAAEAEAAVQRAAEKVEERIAALTSALAGAEAALRTAERECEVALLAAEATARAELERQLDAVRRDHTAELEAQARGAQMRFAEELMSALSAAHATWKQETEKRLREAKEDGLRALAQAEANWRRRHKATLWRAARLWRARERGRLAETKRQWQALHRAALDRVKRRARRSFWQAASVQQARKRLAAFAATYVTPRAPEGGDAAGGMPAAAPLGVMAVALIVVAIHLSPAPPFPDAAPEPMAAASAHPLPRDQVSALASDRANETRPAPVAGVKPAKRATASPTEAELRRGLQEKIRKLRMALPAP